MKGLTNKVLVALSLLSVAGSVFGDLRDELESKMFNNIQGVTVDDMLAAHPYMGKEESTAILDFLKSSITFETHIKDLKSYGATTLVPFTSVVDKQLCVERTVKNVFDFLKPVAEQGAKIQEVAGINAGLEGLLEVAESKKFCRNMAKIDPRSLLISWNRLSQNMRDQYLAAGVDFTSLGVNLGLGGLSDLAKDLSTLTLRGRVAMKNGLINKMSEVVRTVGADNIAIIGAVTGLGLYRLYNYTPVQQWLRRNHLIK